jgi:flagellar biosynthesis component FlhA
MPAKIGNIFIPLFVIIVASSMVVPLPVFLLDFLLTGNLVLAILLLVSAFTITDVLKLSSFPTLILLATLYRLSLNISTSRLILSEGNAGEVIGTLATLMTSGNIAVGFVIFVVISIVQFIVIAKGGERVAEVSARFTLDAMPGKQMSIDAELRAGMLSVEEAQLKRRELQEESRFYGALDGAMKFVKGDAIAGMIIAVVNLVGGVIVGVTVKGDPLLQAISRYSFFTIGDGLVAQVPAVLNALAAGVIVTRVGAAPGKTLATDITDQLFQSSGVQMSIGIGCVGLALMPGLPTWTFLIFGFGLIFSSIIKKKILIKIEKSIPASGVSPQMPSSIEILLPQQMIDVSTFIQPFINALESQREKIFFDLGVLIPRPYVRAGVNNSRIKILLRGDRLENLTLCDDWLEKPQELATLCFNHLLAVVTELIDDKFTSYLLSHYEQKIPDLVAQVIPDIVSTTDLTVLLRSLVAEKVSIRNMDLILQAIAESVPRVGKGRVLLEDVRIKLGRAIMNSTFSDESEIKVIGLSASFDFRCHKLEREMGILDYAEMAELKDFLNTWSEHADALITSRGSRALIYDYVKGLGFSLSVLAIEEIRSLMPLHYLATFDPVNEEFLDSREDFQTEVVATREIQQ